MKPQSVSEVSVAQEWSGVERQLISEGYGMCEGVNNTLVFKCCCCKVFSVSYRRLVKVELSL